FFFALITAIFFSGALPFSRLAPPVARRYPSDPTPHQVLVHVSLPRIFCRRRSDGKYQALQHRQGGVRTALSGRSLSGDGCQPRRNRIKCRTDCINKQVHCDESDVEG
ncbi:TPA: hypothetical protein ACH26M_005084, partial [Serratia marcescens]